MMILIRSGQEFFDELRMVGMRREMPIPGSFKLRCSQNSATGSMGLLAAVF